MSSQPQNFIKVSNSKDALFRETFGAEGTGVSEVGQHLYHHFEDPVLQEPITYQPASRASGEENIADSDSDFTEADEEDSDDYVEQASPQVILVDEGKVKKHIAMFSQEHFHRGNMDSNLMLAKETIRGPKLGKNVAEQVRGATTTGTQTYLETLSASATVTASGLTPIVNADQD